MHKNLYMEKVGKKAKLASLHLSNLNLEKRNSVLKHRAETSAVTFGLLS